MENGNGYYWDSRVECITARTAVALAKLINEFYPGKFVVGTQVFPDDAGWTALVYYKVRADGNARQPAREVFKAAG
jgi:hypothetical protein